MGLTRFPVNSIGVLTDPTAPVNPAVSALQDRLNRLEGRLRSALSETERRLNEGEGRNANILTQSLRQLSPPSIRTNVLDTTSPAFVFGTTALPGSSKQTVRADATVALFNTATPSAVSLSAGAVGTSGKAARADHTHLLADGAGSGLDADLLDGLDSLAFLKADGSVTGTGTQEFSSATPLNLSNLNPTVNFGGDVAASNTLTFHRVNPNALPGAAKVRWENESSQGFDATISTGPLTADFTADTNMILSFTAQGASGDIKLTTGAGDIDLNAANVLIDSDNPIVLDGTSKTLQVTSGTMEVSNSGSAATGFQLTLNDGGAFETTFKFNFGLLTNAGKILYDGIGGTSSEHLQLESAGGNLYLQAFATGKVVVNNDNLDCDFEVHSDDGSAVIATDASLGTGAGGLGFFAATPVVQAGAFTQTFATATRTNNNPVSSALTDSTGGTANTTVAAVIDSGNTTDNSIINDNFADLTAQVNNLRTDVANAKQLINALIDDAQAYGLAQ